eukprot:gene6125-12401_t
MGQSSSKEYSANVSPENNGPGQNSRHEYHFLKLFLNSDPPLIQACRLGNAALVSELIKKSSNSPFTQKNKDGDTALIIASRKGHYKVVKVLLEWIKTTKHGTNSVSVENNKGETALYWAWRGGYQALILLLLEHGAFSLENSKDRTLIWASRSNKFETMRQILQISSQASDGDVPPKKGLEILQDEYVPDMGGIKCVNNTVGKGLISQNKKASSKMSRLMNVAATEEDSIRIKPLLREQGPLDIKDEEHGYTALMWACKNVNISAIELLIDHGASTHIEDNNLETALIHICKQNSKNRPFKRQNINQQGSTVDPVKQVEMAKILLNSEEPIDRKNKDGDTALILACKNEKCKSADIVKELLEAGALVDEKNNEGRTALMFACRNGHEEKVKALLNSKADVNLRDELISAESKCTESKSAESKFAESKSTESKFAESKFAESKSTESKFAESKFAGSKSAESKSAESKFAESKSAIWYAVEKIPKAAIVKILLKAGAREDIQHLDSLISFLREAKNKSTVAPVNGNRSVASGSSIKTTVGEDDFDKIFTDLDAFHSTPDNEFVGNDVCTPVKRDINQFKTTRKQFQKDEQPKQIKGINYKNKNGNEKLVELLLDQKEKKIDVNITDNNRDTPLIVASRQGHTKVVRHLIDMSGCELEFVHQNKEGNTALHYASIGGHLDIVDKLLKNNAPSESNKGEDVTVKMLLTWGLNTSLKNRKGETALVAMCHVEFLKSNHIKIAESLLNSSSFANSSLKSQIILHVDDDGKESGQTAEGSSVQQENALLEKSTEDKGENGGQNLENLNVNRDKDLIEKKYGKVFLDCRNPKKEKGATTFMRQIGDKVHDFHEERKKALYNACERGHIDLVKLLLNRGATNAVKDYEEKTFLRAALTNKHSEVCKLLLRKLKPDYAVRLMLASTTVRDNTLQVSCRRRKGTSRIMGKKHHHQQQVGDTNSEDNSVEWVDVDVDVLSIILPTNILTFSKKEEDCTFKDIVTETIELSSARNRLFVASEIGSSKDIRMILDRTKNDMNIIDIQGQDGDFALALAASRGHLQAVKTLVERKASINLQNKKGSTALILASQLNHDKIVKYLLKQPGIRIDIQDNV